MSHAVSVGDFNSVIYLGPIPRTVLGPAAVG